MATTSPDQEWKKGSAELLVLSLLEDQPRHGYDISKSIQIRSGGFLRFHVTSLYPLLYRLEDRGGIASDFAGGAAGRAPGEPDAVWRKRKRSHQRSGSGSGVAGSRPVGLLSPGPLGKQRRSIRGLT
jgi:hypothetical protein